ncbi:MAG: hypothetical protein ABIJ05_01470 [Patescibacteria group bacterium]
MTERLTNADLYKGLERGLKNREDPVTWRTLGIDLRIILGSPDPEKTPPSINTLKKGTKLVDSLIEGTYLKPLRSEILWSIYGEYGEKSVLPPRETLKPLDVLIINGRHKTESILWSVADYLSSVVDEVAVINPVGHYNDLQTRIIAPDLLVRPVKTAIFLSSTQTEDGGDLSVLNLTLRALRNPNFAYMIDKAVIIMPMFGGSRGHKNNQNREIGYEILETIYNSKLLTNTIDDIRKSIVCHDIYPIYNHVKSLNPKLIFPPVSFVSVDIHNAVLPARKFNEAGYEFVSASPAKEHAEKTLEVLSETGYGNLPKRIISCDEGSISRTDNYVHELLTLNGGEVEIIYLEKRRVRAGEVGESHIKRVVLCHLNSDGDVIEEEKAIIESKSSETCVLIYVDDMVDTGGTAGLDIRLLRDFFPETKYIIFVTTHPVLSQGVKEAINKIGADMYIVGDSLSTKRFSGEKKIRVAGLAPSIARAIGF